mgnify:CR=1 FL=1
MQKFRCCDEGGKMMGIWFWIVLAWLLSALALGKRHISMEHFVWILLPIDMYGIQVAGITIKPYMVFCGWLFLRMLLNGQTKIKAIRGWTLPAIGIIVILFIVNMFNSSSLYSLSAPCMLMVVWFCMTIYTSFWGETAQDDIPEAMIATGIGYGFVFLIGFLLLTLGIPISGVGASERTEPGFILQFSNMFQGVLIQKWRLRGFTIDPNTMLGTFVFSGIVCLIRILMEENSKREWLCLMLSMACIFLSNSRTGLMCFALALVMSVFAAYWKGSPQIRKRIEVITLIVIFVMIAVMVGTDWIRNLISSFLGLYANRSGLNDEYGRFTIWKEAVGILMEKNPFFGIGMGQMQFYTSVNRACHNTWLECLCGNGIILGSIFILFLLFTLIKGGIKAKYNTCSRYNQLLWSLTIGITVVVISLISVDNITYSYLWFGLSALMMIDTASIKEM